MFKKFVLWFVCFGLSFLVEKLGWTEQGKAFLFINLGITGLLIVIIALICLFAGSNSGEKFGLSAIAIFVYVVSIAITLFATWGATKLFNVDYYVAFQIMSFGQCLCTNNTNKGD